MKIGISLPVLGLLMATASAPRLAHAKSGNSFFETIGISIAVGTVLGASTLPFYDQPGKHVWNLGYGAGAGLAVGLGAFIYGWFTGPSQEDLEMSGSLNPSLRYEPSALSRTRFRTSSSARTNIASRGEVLLPSTQAWMPLVSLTW